MDADTPYDHFILQAESASALVSRDATDTTTALQSTIASGCPTTGTLIAGPTDIVSVAGRPAVSVLPLSTQIAQAGQSGLTTANIELTYSGEQSMGNLLLQGLSGTVYRRTEADTSQVNASDIFSEVRLYDGNDLLAVDSTLASAAIDLLVDSGYVIEPGTEFSLSILGNIDDNASIGNYFVQFDDSLFLNLVDNNFASAVTPVLYMGQYPIRSGELSIVEPSLEHSFSNYPNPFVPSRGEMTTFAYVLADNAFVDIELFTTTGDRVLVVLENSLKEAGYHQSEAWDGLNGKGQKVAPGIYICRVTARYESGRTEDFTRRVAVVR